MKLFLGAGAFKPFVTKTMGEMSREFENKAYMLHKFDDWIYLCANK